MDDLRRAGRVVEGLVRSLIFQFLPRPICPLCHNGALFSGDRLSVAVLDLSANDLGFEPVQSHPAPAVLLKSKKSCERSERHNPLKKARAKRGSFKGRGYMLLRNIRAREG